MHVNVDLIHCFDLKLAEYASSGDKRKFVTVNKESIEVRKYEIYHHHNHYNPTRIRKMFILTQDELLLAFDDNEMAEEFRRGMVGAQ